MIWVVENANITGNSAILQLRNGGEMTPQTHNPEIENGIFTHYLIDGLRCFAAVGEDGRTITATSLYHYAHTSVTQATEQRQTPALILPDSKRIGDIVLARKPAPESPTALRTLLEHESYTQRIGQRCR